jgi:hypothetical protein
MRQVQFKMAHCRNKSGKIENKTQNMDRTKNNNKAKCRLCGAVLAGENQTILLSSNKAFPASAASFYIVHIWKNVHIVHIDMVAKKLFISPQMLLIRAA